MFKFIRKDSNPYKRLYPALQARLFSVLVDITLAFIVLIFVLNIANFFGYDMTTASKWKVVNNVVQRPYSLKVWIISQVIQIFLFGSAILVFWLKKYATPGKMILSMKIVNAKTFSNPSVFQLVVRLCSYWVYILPLFFLGIKLYAIYIMIGTFYIVLNKKHRAWHDIISGTVVINTRELKKHPDYVPNAH